MLSENKNETVDDQDLSMDQEIMLIQVNVDMMLDRDNQENMVDV